MIKTRKKTENMEIKEILNIILNLIDSLGMEFTALYRADDRGSADIICRMWCQKVGNAECLIPTYDIILLNHFLNLTNESNLNGRL